MDFQLLCHVVEELSALLTAARIDRVYEGTGGELLIILSRSRTRFNLLLSADRSLPRIHLVSKKAGAAQLTGSFTQYVKSRLNGARIRHISILNQDRVVEIALATRSGDCRLIHELTGSSSNLIFTDSSSKILSVFHLSDAGGRSDRKLLPGMTYTPPPKKHIATSMPERPGPAVVEPLTSNEKTASVNVEAELFFQHLIQEKTIQRLHAELRSILKKSLDKTRRREEALKKRLQEIENLEQFRNAGDVILANLGVLQTGMAEAELAGHDGITSTVALDPKLSPTANAQLYFKKYKKAKAGMKITASRLTEAESEHRRYLELSEETGNIQDREKLCEMISVLKQHGRRPNPGKTIKRDGNSHSSSYRTVMYSGWEILIGKNAAGNDYITMSVARDRDMWLHAEGIPGSHVVIRNPAQGAIPPGVLAKAASCAAFYSKGRAAGKVSVSYALAKHVKKPKGAKPGLVILSERKTIMAVPEEP